MRSYDLVYIVRPDLDTEAMTAVVERVNQRLAEQGTTVEHTETWGKRRMAYPIQRYREGHYVFVRFSAPGPAIPEIRRTIRILEDVLRASVTVAVGSIAPPKTSQPPAAPAGAPVPHPEASPDSPAESPRV
ncbi:MAG: 30S ribosomal protein S6 [Armatimonadetes bacterium]|nr:30S ribosomal protein S6 [Armatimonadota bacterium]